MSHRDQPEPRQYRCEHYATCPLHGCEHAEPHDWNTHMVWVRHEGCKVERPVCKVYNEGTRDYGPPADQDYFY